MYASHRDYDSPPPTSQFRRPWSPEPFDPNPRTDLYDSEVNYSRFPTYNPSTQRREPSVEALDLADYAATLRRQPDYDYNDDPHDYDYDSSIHRGVPSLVSRGETLSSNSHNNASRFRAFSLPPPPPSTQPRIADSDHDIDTSRFPAFTRHWYTAPPLNSLPFDEDPYILPPKRISHTGTPFDPGHTYNSFPTHSTHHSTQYAGSNALPWSSDPDPPSYLDPSLKEERIRMLEREFATTPNAAQQGEEKPQIGMADGKGNLITQGPRKRTATRVFQVLLSLAAGIPGIYAAVAIKTKGTPPPAGTPAAYALYITSVVTFLLLFGLFIVRPCIKRPKEQSAPGVNGMMVLPVGDNNKKKKKKKGKKGGPASQDVQVNLIVDPTMFRPPQEDASDSEDDATRWDGSSSSSRRKKNAKPARRSVFAGLHMEAEWRRARSWAKKVAVVDVFGLIIWGTVFVVVLLGKRCPSGDYEGWCNAYNVSSAAACLLCVAFGVSVFFDIKDLHASKVSPRTR